MKIILGPSSRELSEEIAELSGFGKVPVFLMENYMFAWKVQ